MIEDGGEQKIGSACSEMCMEYINHVSDEIKF